MITEALRNDWLLQAACKCAAVLGTTLLAGLLLHRMAAARRYAMWLAAMGTVAVLPLAVAWLPAWRVLPAVGDEAPAELAFDPGLAQDGGAARAPSAEPAGITPAATTAQQGAAADTPAAVSSDVPRTTTLWHWLPRRWPLLAWLAGTAFLLLRLAWGMWRLGRLQRALLAGDCDLLAQVARDLCLRRPPVLCVGAPDAVPMVWGIWQPCLLLPQGFESWPREKLRSVLLHELAHLQRRDPLALWLSQMVKALHWFNPLAWLTFRQLRLDQERSCDDTVLRHGVRASEYAQHLLDLSRQTRIGPGLALCALTITRSAPVEARVRAVLDAGRARQPLTRRWLAGMAGLALLTALPVAMLHALEAPKLRGRLLDRNGVVLAESTPAKARHYPLKLLAAHVVGYVGKPAPDAPVLRGRAGLEEKHDAALAQGEDVSLSVDGRMQFLTARAMQEAGVARGAAVVLDPRTGEILAAVSLPAYDAGEFVPSLVSGKSPVLSRSHERLGTRACW